MNVFASAPANIALIKYMGKTDVMSNRPTNSSLSWTLGHLQTFVRISALPADASEDQWSPLLIQGAAPFEMSDKGRERFLRHFKNLKDRFHVKGHFLIESANNFPSDCGLASSASSFAALTKAAIELFAKMDSNHEEHLALSSMAEFSRLGSGSSCRSFFEPWALWFSEGVKPLEFPYMNLYHQVVVVESSKKKVSSSEAHRRVVTSPLFNGRIGRAEMRLADLIYAFEHRDWRKAYETVWAEFWDMHALFETSTPHFGYLQPGSLEVLRYIDDIWNAHGDGPLVTMDAGPNVHFLYREDQLELAQQVREHLSQKFQIFDPQSMQMSAQEGLVDPLISSVSNNADLFEGNGSKQDGPPSSGYSS